MTFFNFSLLANASAPLFARYSSRYIIRYSTRNFWPVSPIALAAMLQQLEPPATRSKLQISGIQPGCSVLLCNEAQQCEWLTLLSEVPGNHSDTEIALLSPLGMALVGKNVGDEVRLLVANRQSSFIVADIIRVRRQPGNLRK
ncbi:hypothetical protein A5320_01685 [Rheinheimera sp. SA_1]|uniref:GreA/GreB family elongation factor n=1 Tax=Rheinheimera sp. SA_1 TaxID=1827365 RepID=UPI0007FCB6A8|nr:GreA/GreB family elongation factor [Rheinheimera sp. SA_1]OBP16156.1 hypothetical protein A5320_01685 [Rheinheimera sp. SA_1]